MLITHRINFLLSIYKITKSEKLFNRIEKLTEKKIQQLQHQTFKSRWEKVQLEEELKQFQDKQ